MFDGCVACLPLFSNAKNGQNGPAQPTKELFVVEANYCIWLPILSTQTILMF
jgi:hypothetical protein